MLSEILTKFGSVLRKLVEKIYFTNIKTAEYWTGYMNRVIRSGEKVAREILG
jgi:monoamine oxidase